MKQIGKKLGSVFLVLCMVLTLLPTVAFAANASSLESTIESYTGGSGATGSLSASVSGSTVTVTGTVTNAASTLLLEIGAGVTVDWQASITAASDFTGYLLELFGSDSSNYGSFTVDGGAITTGAGNAIFILYYITLTVRSGTVSSEFKIPIVISNSAASLNVCGTGQVLSTSDHAIVSSGSVTVSENARVSSSEIAAIFLQDPSATVSVTGGSVSNSYSGTPTTSKHNDTGVAICAVNGASTVSVSGGTVSGSNCAANSGVIYMYGSCNETFENVTVSGSGQVLATDASSPAIYSKGTVVVKGGTVFGSGTEISNVIDCPAPFSAPIDNGVVIARNQSAGITQYEKDTSTGLTVSPDGATAKWAKSGDQSGISYSYSGNSGFLAVDGVTVVNSSVTTDELNYTDPSTLSLSYNGSAQGIGIVSAASGVTLGTITVYYTGINGTDYAKSTTAPTNAGTYQVTADVAENDDYAATSGLVLGSYTIAKAAVPTLTWPAAADITYGQTLADSALTGGSALGTFTWTDGTVAPNVGAGGYWVTFTPSNSTLQNYETITDTTKLVSVTVTKATATGVDNTYQVKTYLEYSYTFDLTSLLPSGVDASQVSAYTITGNTNIYGIFSGECSISGTSLTLAVNSVVTAGLSDTVTIGFTSENYDIGSATITFETTDKTPVSITAAMTGGVYNGQPCAYSNAAVTNNTDGTIVTDVTLTASYEGVDGTTYGPSATAPTNAGSYQLTLSVPDTDATYSGSTVYTFTIAKRPVTVKADDKSVTVGSDPVFTYTVDGQLSGETALSSEPDLAFAEGNTTKAGSYTIGVFLTGVTYTDNYTAANPAYVNGTLTVSTASPGGNTPSGGGSSTPSTPAPTVSGSTATTTVTAQTGTNGTATATVTQSQITSAIEKAQAAAKSSGEAPRMEIQVSGASDASAVETTLPKAAVQALVTGEMESLTLSSNVADITFDAQAIAAIAGASTGDVNISAAQVENSTLSGAAAQVVGNRPVYHFSVTSGGNTISEFGGAVTVSVPYNPAVGEDTNAIVAYYINANGEPELMQNCHYDTKSGTLVFTTTHFSTYAVGYNKVAFSDVSDSAWYADAVSYLAARSITGGTSETTFSPDATLTRGQFITLLLRAYGIDADSSTANNFADAGNTYYTGYLAAAKRLGISNGVGDNKFAPEQAVTRQDMFTLLYNALKAIDQLPEDDSGKTLSDFTDSANISSYAQDAMAYLVKTGVVGGNNGQLSPTNTTTRAQMAQVLYNLLSK